MVYYRSPSYSSGLALLGHSHLTESILFKGPLTEEFVFRACVIALLHFAGYSNMYLVFASSLYFGIGEFRFFFSGLFSALPHTPHKQIALICLAPKFTNFGI